jgi:pimeloyl-ACP methyl ester carboxylesterase
MNSIENVMVGHDSEAIRQFDHFVEYYNQFDAAAIAGRVETHVADNGTGLLLAHPVRFNSMDAALEHDPRILVSEHLFANGFFPWKKITAQFLADQFDTAVVGVAAPSTDIEGPKFSRKEKRSIKKGDTEPISQKTLEAINRRLPDVGRAAIVGWSQGAMLALTDALAMSRHYDIDGVAAGDPTNVTKRGKIRMMMDFGKAGYPDLEKELRAAGLNPLLESFGYEGAKRKGDMSRTYHYLNNILAARQPNFRLLRAMGTDTLADRVMPVVEKGIPVLLARGEQSAMTPASDFERHLGTIAARFQGDPERLSNVGALTFEGTKHTGGDHIGKYALLAQLARA